ncbi:Lin0368 family putative glycerol transporter subunit [Caproiciproducens sp. MSJ-32]|uniref:Lin0368 family putative glycerol transporter subunit n=1 Tax=Caproiciproducens sp. MSJ-32 TaxID=2841527 RepID=UPI001C1006B5|nr:hypothetical protein [Caproiciproducens sp. MSJ-32]MBU5456070.1 hypothetical protein [Caproiciproducens sp. MSJ-32]
MTLELALATIVGGFLFPFLIRMYWGGLVDKFGPIGGFMAAGFIVGTAWALNHGVGLITQSGPVWVDMGFAAGIGLCVASAIQGGKVKKAIPQIGAALVGGTLAGFILSIIL